METSWSKTKTKQEPLWSLVTVYTDYLRSPRTVTTHRLVAFQVSDVWFRLQLFRTGTASISVSAAAAAVASTAAAQLVDKMGPLIPARLRMLYKTATGHLSLPPLTKYALAIWSSTSTPYFVMLLYITDSGPTKGAHSCVNGAQDADILTRLSPVHSQSHICVEQLCLLFHGGGSSRFCLLMVPTRQYNTTIW